MAESVIQKGSGGAASDECTAGKAQVLAGYTAVTKDSGDEPVAGTMAANGNMTAALNCGQSKVIPAGYTPGGTVTANSLASQTGGVTAEDKYVLNGKTYWRDGVKRTGSMTVASVASFSVAPYSTSQVLATWKNPGRGPYSGIIICAKTGGYPANINDGRVYTGVGSNSAVNGTSSQVIGGLAAGTTYYFRIWVYCTCSAGDQYSGYLQATCAPTAHGRAAFTASGTWTVPANVRSINIHCTGAGSAGKPGVHVSLNRGNAGGGGGGGCTSYKNGIPVSPGQNIVFIIGAGLIWNVSNGEETGASSASLNGTVLVKADGAHGGRNWTQSGVIYRGGYGASDGGDGASGGYNGEWGQSGRNMAGGSDGGGNQQKTTTREFGTGTLYGAGGGGGGVDVYHSGSESTVHKDGGAGGAGGGGNGANYNQVGANATAGSGSGGGGGSYGGTPSSTKGGGAGASGNVIITW